MNFKEICFWNNMSYGKAKKIKPNTIKRLIWFFCMITPGTNFFIPILLKLVPKNNIIIRYNN